MGGIFVIVCVQKPSHQFLQIFRPLRMFKIVLRDSSLYPKQLPLFCLLRLISASAKRIGYISNFCSMIKLLHELKTAVVNIEAFRHLIMSQQGKRKTKRLLDFQARHRLGTPGGEKSFPREGQFFKTMSNSFKIRQHIFPVWTKIFLGEASLPPGYGPVDFCTSQKTNVFLHISCAFSILV